jgi:hypothetical protein
MKNKKNSSDGFSPATGGKKIARIPRKMSEPHMIAFEQSMGYLSNELSGCTTVSDE